MSTLAERLKEALKEADDMKPAELSRRANVSKATVSLWLKGTTKQLDGENLLKAAQVLGVEARWLQTGALPKSKNVKPGSNTTTGNAHQIPILPWAMAHLNNTDEANSAALGWMPQTHYSRRFLLFSDSESHYGSTDLALAPGYTILIDPDVTADEIKRANLATIAVVHLPSGDNLLRKIVTEGSRSYLRALNPSYGNEPMPEGAEVIGFVVGARYTTALGSF